MLVSCREMAEAEETLFAQGGEAEPLMEKAGRGCAEAIFDTCARHGGHAVLHCGKGNNGGDALVAGRWLRQWGWRVEADFTHPPAEMSPLAAKKRKEFEDTPDSDYGTLIGHRYTPLVLVDGLLGIGARGPLRGTLLDSAERLARRRLEENGTCFAIDIPSGLDGDSGEPYAGAIVADVTLSICAPKRGIIADQAIDHVGRIAEIPLPEIPVESSDPGTRLLFPSSLRPRLPRRPFDFHKGRAGRVAIIAGSRGFTGAPVLAALGASRGGAGLVTLLVPEECHSIVAAKTPPEVMVRPFASPEEAAAFPADLVAIGPGLGPERAEQFLPLMRQDPRPLIIDADGLNALAGSAADLAALPVGKRLLTPHPGELSRLTARCNDELPTERAPLTRKLADDWNLTLLHKGARSAVASPGRPVELNTTGHPGMASGGMGDVLTGLCAALAAQGCSLHDAACIGSWLLGRAAELAVRDGAIAPESVTATRVAEKLGSALQDLKG